MRRQGHDSCFCSAEPILSLMLSLGRNEIRKNVEEKVRSFSYSGGCLFLVVRFGEGAVLFLSIYRFYRLYDAATAYPS